MAVGLGDGIHKIMPRSQGLVFLTGHETTLVILGNSLITLANKETPFSASFFQGHKSSLNTQEDFSTSR